VFKGQNLAFVDCIKGYGEMGCGFFGDKGEVSRVQLAEIIESGIFSVDFDVFLVEGRPFECKFGFKLGFGMFYHLEGCLVYGG